MSAGNLVKVTLTITRLGTGETATLSAGRVKDAEVSIDQDPDERPYWDLSPTAVTLPASSRIRFTGEMLRDGDHSYTITKGTRAAEAHRDDLAREVAQRWAEEQGGWGADMPLTVVESLDRLAAAYGFDT